MNYWPVTLREDTLVLRPLSMRDAKAFKEVRQRNRRWLARWEASSPELRGQLPTFRQMVRHLSSQARSGSALPFAIEFEGEFAGQLTVSGITWGSLRSVSIGYWIDERWAGRGLVPTSVALATDFCFFELNLHRAEINIRPENKASLRVVEKLGFRDEGVREQYLHIDGEWRDHRSFALVVDDIPGGLLNYWKHVRAGEQGLAGPGA
ncbi:GNAT family protein [Saxibacter everestensis]|uniref:GNAT family protein n=1 Tax=Saxibacter everestensis TaxID=2909229 RepID=A0ABY8QWU3_9MICO|nr:GNAT family protein [Brevibacteriaceae bacterium ZFBP1038]